MPRTKGLQNTVDKWQRRAAVSQPEYQQGIQNPRAAWDAASTAANDSYKTAVTTAATQNRYSAGVQKAGLNKWQQAALRKGPARFVEGVSFAAPEFQNQIQGVLQTIEGVQLPARGPKGSAQNYQRVAPIGEALRKAFGKGGAK